LKRFFTPLLVLSLGIFISYTETRPTGPGSPFSQAGSLIRVVEVRADSAERANMQAFCAPALQSKWDT